MEATTLSENQGKRSWIYARKVKGPLFTYRQYVGYLLLGLLIAIPFIKINGEPLLLFNILERKFVVFGSVFFTQDLHIFVFGMLVAMVGIVLFTVVYGRVWCGWACPQTIFMELVFRRIEYWIEGDANEQRKLAKSAYTTTKFIKKLCKHSLFFIVSFFIANIFLSYILGVEALFRIINDPVEQHIGGLVSIFLFSCLFYGVFAYVREIVCTTICPYGRLQGVLLDDQTITVAYHYKRGEPRGKLNKLIEEKSTGDCVDCGLCVQVCPTGIDIRNGIQLECVNCTACIDACDAVMEKIQKPKKLIGFYTSRDIDGLTLTKKKNTRAIAYSIVLVVLMSVFFGLIMSRSAIDGTLLRAKGTSYIFRDDGTVTNLYNMELTNKTSRTLPFTVISNDEHFTIQTLNNKHALKKGESVEFSFFLIAKKNKIKKYKTDVYIRITSNGKDIKKMKTSFVAPVGTGQ
jgi:cytochrome c oxidase accessory protein FixG